MVDNEIVKGIMVNQGVADFTFKYIAHENSEIALQCSRILLKLCSLYCMRAYCRKTFGLQILVSS